MINLEKMKKIDISRMYEVYDKWPLISEQSFNEKYEQIEYKNLENIIFAGMGGSGSIGDIFTAILSKTELHSSVVKGYILPKTVNKNSLIVVTSVSGNTDEAYHILQDAYEKHLRIICFSSGGKIEEFCKKNSITHQHIEKIHSPRASLTKFLFTMIKILQPNIPVSNNDVIESIQELKKLNLKINSSSINDENVSYTLAKWITNIPIIYYPWGLQAAAIRFKSSLQENAKMHAMTEDVIEASHNGIVGWEKISNLKPIFIRGRDDYVKTKERWEIFNEYFTKNKIDFKIVHSSGKGILAKIVYLIYLLDYCSIYRSILSNIDPSPVNSVDFIKKRLI